MLGKWRELFRPFDVVVVGDNHHGFLTTLQGTTTKVLNCGTLLRRKASEINLTPSVGIVYASGDVERHYLDVERDVITKMVEVELPTTDEEIQRFVGALANLATDSLDFRDAVRRATKDVPTKVRDAVLEAMGE
jgi:hypothetical protein